jgi:hypothetical protein
MKEIKVHTIIYLEQNNAVFLYDVLGRMRGPFKPRKTLRIQRSNLVYNSDAKDIIPGDICFIKD